MKNVFNKIFINSNRERLGFYVVLIISLIVSIISTAYYFQNGYTLLYGDAKSHLNIAQRVISSITPGVTQLGGIWLPLPHLLDLLTIWNSTLYYTGLSGTIISMISYVVSAIMIYKLIYLYSKNLIASLVGCSILIFNSSYLYLQSTPMTEALSLATFLTAIYLIAKWSKTQNLFTLIIAGIITAIATLSRYDSWSLVPAATLAIFIHTLFSQKGRKLAESNTILYFVPAAFGIALWLLYNFLIFGNALNFSSGVGSASYDAAIHLAPTIHNVGVSLLTYIWLMIENIGYVSLGLLIIGVLAFLVRPKKILGNLPALLLIVPILFNIVSLYSGQSIAMTIHLAPYSYYDTRYGINALPAAAFFIGLLIARIKYSRLPIIALILIQSYLLFSTQPGVLKEAILWDQYMSKPAVSWVLEHPNKGYTLLSLRYLDAFSFAARIPQSSIIQEGNDTLWKVTLKNPEKHATRVIISNVETGNTNELVRTKLLNSETLNKNYTKVYEDSYLQIYDRNMAIDDKQISNSTVLQSKVAGAVACQYTVINGDSLWKIAKKISGQGKEYEKIVEDNDLLFPYIVHPGDTLTIPCSSK